MLTQRPISGLIFFMAFLLVAFDLGRGSQAGATVLYDSTTGLSGQAPFQVFYGSQVTFAGPNVPYSLTSFSSFGIRWDDVSQGSQIVQFDIYSGANLSPTSPNAFANATLDAQYAFYISDPGNYQYFFYTLTFPSPVRVPSNTIAVTWTLDNGSYSAYSNAVNALIYQGPSVPTGSDTGFIWQDKNGDGILSGSEQSTTAGGGTAAHVPFVVNGTALPEPGAAPVLLLVAAMFLWQRHRTRRAV